MLYEMLTGQTPFQGPNPFAVMNDRLNNPVPPREMILLHPSYRRSSIALERDPKNRYATARNDRNPASPSRWEWRIARDAGLEEAALAGRQANCFT
jgi:serine/threonine protein kinase